MIANPHRLAGLEALRGLAALLVVIHHLLEELSPLFPASAWLHAVTLIGAAGVDVFFVISGFIMVRSSRMEFGRPGAVAKFLLKRTVRIYPLHWACLILTIAAWSTGAAYRSLQMSVENLVGSVLLAPIGGPLRGITWTLYLEMLFYACFAIGLLFRTARSGTIVCSVLVTTIFLITPWAPDDLAQHTGSPLVFEFLAGVGLGLLLGERPSLLVVLHRWRYVGCMAAWFGFVLGAVQGPAEGTGGLLAAARVWLWGGPALLLVAVCLTLEPGRRAERLSLWGGRISYALYLTHPFVMIVIATLVVRGWVTSVTTGAMLTLLGVLASLILAVVAHRWIEAPAARWASRRVRMK